MPGAYLLAILVSGAGIVIIDRRFRLALWHDVRRTAIVVAVGVAGFLAWDAVGIATNVFFKGESAYFVGIVLAPELPLEEVFFLTFLCYLTVVCFRGAMRVLERPRPDRRVRHGREQDVQP